MFKCSICPYVSARRTNVDRHRASRHYSVGETVSAVGNNGPLPPIAQIANTNTNHIEGNNNTTNNTNNNTTNTTNNTYNININVAAESSSSSPPNVRLRNFGDEVTSYISVEMNDRCLLVLCTTGLDEMVRAVHLNDAHPENHNVKIFDQRANLMQYFIDGQWVCRSKHDILNALINNTTARMEQLFASRHRDDETAMQALTDQIVQKHKEKVRCNLRSNLYGSFLHKHKSGSSSSS